jgi:hypothetical protein
MKLISLKACETWRLDAINLLATVLTSPLARLARLA